LDFLMEAHSGLSARIAVEAGFEGLWGSGLSISANLGVRDSNEASWTQVLEVAEFMADAADAPILLDGDTGYGNFNNVRRLVRKLESRGIAGVCFEDKLFPKTNSFLDPGRQQLADPDEFAGKIRAAKDTQEDSDFVVVARTEAFIAGWGLEEALRRAEAYAAAGADAILCHSKKRTAEDVLAFMDAWDGRCPVVIVPTTYGATPTEVFEEAGVSLAIWANHQLRASIMAMQGLTRRLFEERSLMSVEEEVAPLGEVFRLQGASELKAAEKVYLPAGTADSAAIVLAASRGSALGELTAERPKTMVPVRGVPLLERLVGHLRECHVGRVRVVVGYRPEAVDVAGIEAVENPEYASTKEVASLRVGLEGEEGPRIVSYGDVLFKRYILRRLLDEPGDVVVVVDESWREDPDREDYQDLVRCSRAPCRRYDAGSAYLEDMGPGLSPDEVHGEWIGLLRTSAEGTTALRTALDRMATRDDFATLRMKDLFAALHEDGVAVRVVYVSGHWLDVDDVAGFEASADF
jgi:phosphoenolpyruvate phosphomutase